MSLSDTCVRHRERERQALKPFLMLSLIGSVALHGGLILYATSQGYQPSPSSKSISDATPVDLLIQQPSSKAASTAPVQASAPVALVPTTLPPISIEQAPSWADSSAMPQPADLTPPLDRSALPKSEPFGAAPSLSSQSLKQASSGNDSSQQEPSPLTPIPSPEQQTSSNSSPLQPLSPATPLAPVVPSSPATAPQASPTATQPPLASLPLVQPSATDPSQSVLPGVSGGNPSGTSSGTTQASPFATAFRQWFAPLTSGTTSSGSGSGVGTAIGKSGSGQSLGTGASSLGGLVARNVSQGWPQTAVSSAVDPANQTTCVSCSKPNYPVAAQRQGRQGAVKIGLDYDAEGNVVAVHLLQSSGYDDLDRAAIAEAKRWKLKPGKNNNRNFVAAIDFQSSEQATSNAIQSRPKPDPVNQSTPASLNSRTVRDVRRSLESPRPQRDDPPRVSDLETAPTGADVLRQPVESRPTVQPKGNVPALEPDASPEQSGSRATSSYEPSVSDLATPTQSTVTSSGQESPNAVAQ